MLTSTYSLPTPPNVSRGCGTTSPSKTRAGLLPLLLLVVVSTIIAGCKDKSDDTSMVKTKGFDCHSCGRHHDELPMSFGADSPVGWDQIPVSERSTKGTLEQEWCIIGDDSFFIRGCLDIPVKDGPGPFTWIVWVSLSKDNFDRARKLWNDPARVNERPYFGWLCTALPGYSQTTVHLKTNVHSRKVGERPYIELELTDHLLAVEQRDGITMARVQQLVETALHGK